MGRALQERHGIDSLVRCDAVIGLRRRHRFPMMCGDCERSGPFREDDCAAAVATPGNAHVTHGANDRDGLISIPREDDER